MAPLNAGNDSRASHAHTCAPRTESWICETGEPGTGHERTPGGAAVALALRAAGGAALAALLLLATPLGDPPVADAATDVSKVGTCLLAKCQGALAGCVGDPTCLQDLVCLNLCNFADDQIACQIRCGDLLSDQATDTFNACAVTEQKCVPQRVDKDRYPVPTDCALDKKFDLPAFEGRWFITAGQNPLFDTFPCQEHIFAVPEPGKLVGKINWRIPKPDDFIERSTTQIFVQDPANPALLLNHGNEYLHYQDDWYILSSSFTGDPDTDHVFVYYRGVNDAWDGYGGAVVYTRARTLPPGLVPRLSEAAESAGLSWSQFQQTDNTCGPRPAKKGLVGEVETELEGSLRSFGKGFTVLEDRVAKEFVAEEREVADELRAAQRAIERVERRLADEAAAEEKLVENELGVLGAALQRLRETLRL